MYGYETAGLSTTAELSPIFVKLCWNRSYEDSQKCAIMLVSRRVTGFL